MIESSDNASLGLHFQFWEEKKKSSSSRSLQDETQHRQIFSDWWEIEKVLSLVIIDLYFVDYNSLPQSIIETRTRLCPRSRSTRPPCCCHLRDFRRSIEDYWTYFSLAMTFIVRAKTRRWTISFSNKVSWWKRRGSVDSNPPMPRSQLIWFLFVFFPNQKKENWNKTLDLK